MIFDLITARHLDFSSIGYLLLPKSRLAGSAVSSHLDTRCQYIGLNSRYRTATELISTANLFRMIRRVRLLNLEV
eukprot:2413575-Pyramimonas_sp.AAC.1